MPLCTTRVWSARVSLLLAVAAAILGMTANLACSRHDAAEEDADGSDASAPPRAFDASPAHRGDASPSVDARAEEERASLADAGRFCGAKDLPDCPLQAWMKQNATTLLAFGEISSVAEVFDQIALFAPPTRAPDGLPVYANWASIARDGAAAARMGDLPAARAACRGCHEQYLATYHWQLRAQSLPPLPLPTRP